MMQGPLGSPFGGDIGEDNIISPEHRESTIGVAGSGASSSKPPLVVVQGSGVTKGINFMINSPPAQAPPSLSANVSKESSDTASMNLCGLSALTSTNLYAGRPDQCSATPAAAPAAVSGELSLMRNGISSSAKLNNSTQNISSPADGANAENSNSANDDAYDTTHVACVTSNTLMRRPNTDKITSSSGMRYKECLKNHAANMGGYAVDGCGEFMPSGEEGSLEALKCAACGCHRNFHRREVNGGGSVPTTTSNSMGLMALPSTIMNPSSTSTSNSDYGEGDYHNHTSNTTAGSSGGGSFPGGHYNAGHVGPLLAHPHHHHHHHQYLHAWMQGGRLTPVSAASAGHHGSGLPAHYGSGQGLGGQYAYISGMPGTRGISGHGIAGVGVHMTGTTSTPGKRFRTKFTIEQREKMFEFSEKVGWRIHKQDEAAVQQFCAETGVKRHVLKVWMHNNKNTFGKKL